MTAECARTKLMFQGLDGRDVVGRFDGGEITSGTKKVTVPFSFCLRQFIRRQQAPRTCRVQPEG